MAIILTAMVLIPILNDQGGGPVLRGQKLDVGAWWRSRLPGKGRRFLSGDDLVNVVMVVIINGDDTSSFGRILKIENFSVLMACGAGM